LSNASDGYTSFGTGESALSHDKCELYAFEKLVS
jgi:hypothetical protein